MKQKKERGDTGTMMTVINHELERKCSECAFHKVIILANYRNQTFVPKHICVACDTKEAEEWGKTHECPLK